MSRQQRQKLECGRWEVAGHFASQGPLPPLWEAEGREEEGATGKRRENSCGKESSDLLANGFESHLARAEVLKTSGAQLSQLRNL